MTLTPQQIREEPPEFTGSYDFQCGTFTVTICDGESSYSIDLSEEDFKRFQDAISCIALCKEQA